MNEAEYVRIFDSLKPKDIIQMAVSSIMGGPLLDKRFHDFVVGRASRDKYGYQHWSLQPVGYPKPTNPMNKFRLSKKGTMVTASLGDLALNLRGLRLPGSEGEAEKTAQFRRKLLAWHRSGILKP